MTINGGDVTVTATNSRVLIASFASEVVVNNLFMNAGLANQYGDGSQGGGMLARPNSIVQLNDVNISGCSAANSVEGLP